MYDSFLVREGSLANVYEDGKAVGFKFDVRIGEYRGCFLSLVHGYYVNMDGVEYPRSVQKFEVNGKAPRTFEEIKKATWEHWDYGDFATLYVEKEGGLEKGNHKLGLMQGLLTQYGWQPHDQEWIDHTPEPRELAGKQADVYYYDLELK